MLCLEAKGVSSATLTACACVFRCAHCFRICLLATLNSTFYLYALKFAFCVTGLSLRAHLRSLKRLITLFHVSEIKKKNMYTRGEVGVKKKHMVCIIMCVFGKDRGGW